MPKAGFVFACWQLALSPFSGRSSIRDKYKIDKPVNEEEEEESEDEDDDGFTKKKEEVEEDPVERKTKKKIPYTGDKESLDQCG